MAIHISNWDTKGHCNGSICCPSSGMSCAQFVLILWSFWLHSLYMLILLSSQMLKALQMIFKHLVSVMRVHLVWQSTNYDVEKWNVTSISCDHKWMSIWWIVASSLPQRCFFQSSMNSTQSQMKTIKRLNFVLEFRTVWSPVEFVC
jgi:hypothetical protein